MQDTVPDSPLERLRKKLYSPPSIKGAAPASVGEVKLPPAEGWKPEPPPPPDKPKLPASVAFLLFGVGFFALAGIVAGVVLFLGGRSLSSDNLSITVEGPTTVSGGEEVSFFVAIRNNNPTVAEHPVLTVSFPAGTFEVGSASVPLTNYSEELSDIAAGETARVNVRAAFFGQEGARLSLPISVEYVTGQSNATFVAKDAYDLIISTAPVTLSVVHLSEIAPGQPLSLIVKARSNAKTTLQNVAVRADYPFGFTSTSEEPRSSGGYFTLGTLSPGEEKEIRIIGTLSGVEGEERVFRFSVGTLPTEGAKDFAVPYSSANAALTLARPFLSVSLSVNRSESDTAVITTGQENFASVAWRNVLTVPIQDARIEIRLSGDALDTGSVQVTNGFYSSASRTVLFDRDNTEGLASLSPGADGNGSFTFRTKSGSAAASLRNPSISMDVSVSGRRLGEGNVPETVSSTITRTLKLASDLTLSAQAVRTVGPYENTGPWPPVANTETTYTILLSGSNTVNTVANGTVRATLPSYVRFTGQASSGITYNETTREVIWSMGELATHSSKEVTFQVGLLPSVSQQGTSPKLTSDLTITGYDRFAGVELRGEAPAPTTRTDTDPAYDSSRGIVK